MAVFKRMPPSILRIALGLCFLAFALSGLVGVVSASDAPNSQYFPETGHTVSGAFLQYWRVNGANPIFGLPITDERYETNQKGERYLTQWFERARFEQHDNNSTIQLGMLGRELRGEALDVDPDYQPTAEIHDPSLPDSVQTYDSVTKHNLRGVFLQYWNAHGGAPVFGHPISEEHREYDPATGNSYMMQWFEWARFEYHPEKAPPNDILLGLLGSEIQKPRQKVFTPLWKTGQPSSFLSDPNSIYVDSSGNIYVNDRGSGRINKYDAKYTLINYWYMDNQNQAIAGFPQSNNNDKDAPLLFEIGLSQSVVKKLMPNGTWQDIQLHQADSAQSVAVRYRGLAVDDKGDIYLLHDPSDLGSNQYLVWKYDPNGLFLGYFVPITALSDPTSLMVSENIAYIADGSTNRWKAFSVNETNPGGNALFIDSGFALPQINGTPPGGAMSITLGADKRVYVGEPGRIVPFDMYGQADSGKSFGGSPGRANGQFEYPASLFVTADKVYICDPMNHNINIFSLLGSHLASFPTDPLNADNMLVAANSVAALDDATGRVMVSDPFNKTIKVFQAAAHDKPVSYTTDPDMISGLAVNSAGRIFALSTSTNSVVIYDANGQKTDTWNAQHNKDMAFTLPMGIAIAPDDSVYIADTGNSRIEHFSKQGDLIGKWGSHGAGDSEFGGNGLNNIYDGPTSIAVEPSTHNVYVVDPAQARILKFDANGKFLSKITAIQPNTPFVPIAVAEPPASAGLANPQAPPTQATAPTAKATADKAGVYILCIDGIYRLAADNSVIAQTITRSPTQGINPGDSGTGGVGNLLSLTVNSTGDVFATDAKGRFQKFHFVP